MRTNSKHLILDALTKSFEEKVDHSLLVRRLGIAANDTQPDDGYRQLDLFTDFDALERERNMQRAMLQVRRKYGLNAVVKGMNLMEGATTIERNQQIGGHRAGSPVENGKTSIIAGSKKAR